MARREGPEGTGHGGTLMRIELASELAAKFLMLKICGKSMSTAEEFAEDIDFAIAI